ncbi:MAG: elongation factor G [Acidobacteria bacterium]|nr:elongation factor G [Acidobacteriota bacterium]MCI0626338.1 elongation factor G [Acidobacteriota bacterium]MCI0718523.1 elongation factor G [Acidobacteriota bacterium]
MKVFGGANIRNVAVAGHGSSGKTSLVAGCLYLGGVGNRLGRVDDGTTLTDFDPEEIERKISISSAIAFSEWNKTKINFLDTPGKGVFIQDTRGSMRVCESALVLVDAVAGVEVQTEKVLKFSEEFSLPAAFVVNKLDRENASFDRAVASLQENFGRTALPIQLPVGAEKSFRGIVDLIELKAYEFEPNGDGKSKPVAIPAALQDAAAKGHEAIVEMVAEGNDQLMEEFFDKGTIPLEDLVPGLRQAIAERKIHPIVAYSALLNVGPQTLVDFIVNYLPSPVGSKTIPSTTTAQGDSAAERSISAEGPLSVFVFKTLADPFAGRLSFLKVFSGVLKTDATVMNLNRGTAERLAHLAIPQGKTPVEVPELHAGDIGVVAKLKDTVTGDTLGDKDHPVFYQKLGYPEPLITFAIEPKSRGDEDKISSALHRLLEEDPTLRFGRDQQTHEMLLSGMGQLHIETIVARLKKRFGVEVTLKPPKVPYRETIRGRADVQGRHKKQSGGHGQYGDCKIKMEPLPRGDQFEFVNEIFGGAIPKNFIPAVEKGILESAARGYLAGYPVVDFRVILYDGSYHDVDSSEMAFKIAGSLAFKKAMELANPVLLEPIMNVEVYAPDAYAGDLMGDLNSRRGRVQGMDSKAAMQVIKAQVPMSEMLSYAPTLTSMTQGRGDYTMEFSHYEVVPSQIAEKIVAQAKAVKAGVAEAES